MIWKAVRHSLISELLMWVVVLVLAGLVSILDLHVSTSSTVFILAMFVLFFYIYRTVSRRL